MTERKLQGVFLGLTITSTWGNGHATTYRALLKEFAALGHQVTFLEQDAPWYADNRELDQLPYCSLELYENITQLQDQYGALIREADFVVIGSYVPAGTTIGEWVNQTAPGLKVFYDIDTPVTLANVAAGKCEYLTRELISQYDLYLSFTGGPTLAHLENKLHSPCARALYCSVDPSLYFPEPGATAWDLAYLGTYAEDRQKALAELLLSVAEAQVHRSFAVAGPQYPDHIAWPDNVERMVHLPASEHRRFYNSQTFTLNLTRREMIKAGYSPSVRLFEAAACGVPILTDCWPGLETFFKVGSEILPVRTAQDVTSNLQMSLDLRQQIAARARARTLRSHTAAVRARELEEYILAARERVSHQKNRSKVSISQSETASVS